MFRARKSITLSASRTLGFAIPFCAACGFSQPTPMSMAGSGGSAAPVAGTGGTAPTTGGGGAGVVAGGTAGGGSGQGGSVEQGGAAGGGGMAGGGTGGFSVAGGPPAFSNKPLSVIAYSPYRDGQAPGGAQPSEEQVREDLEILKPLVDGVRVYGTDGANAYVPKLCDELGIELHIGAWIDGLASDGPNVAELASIVNANHPSIKTAIIGNEVLEREDNGVTEQQLIGYIEMAKGLITAPITIAAADTYPVWMANRPNLAASVDLLIWHTYGWWAGADIASAYPLVSKRYDDMMALYPGKDMLLGETGWPSMFDRMSMDMSTTAMGTEANQARFYREALAGLRARNLRMWMFSSFDEQWKASSGEGMVGAWWGIFTTARQPKAAATELMEMIQQ
jgi:exo-beta-1,3-glucanase (GH17 family)